MSQLIFDVMLAVILLGFYVWSIVDAVLVLECKKTLGTGYTKVFSSNMSYILSTLGALISSTVVGILGATKPTEFPIREFLESSLKGKLRTSVKTAAALLPSIFILVWLICGVVTVIFGFILSDIEHVPPFTAAAKAWFGVAIAFVYAYFGINPKRQ